MIANSEYVVCEVSTGSSASRMPWVPGRGSGVTALNEMSILPAFSATDAMCAFHRRFVEGADLGRRRLRSRVPRSRAQLGPRVH
jgi:hypothetical protein